jgi:hypothetical protein
MSWRSDRPGWCRARTKLVDVGEVKEHEADVIVREEQVWRELGACGPLLLLLRLLCQPISLSLAITAKTNLGLMLG